MHRRLLNFLGLLAVVVAAQPVAVAESVWFAEPLQLTAGPQYTEVALHATATDQNAEAPALLLHQDDDYWVFGELDLPASGEYTVSLKLK